MQKMIKNASSDSPVTLETSLFQTSPSAERKGLLTCPLLQRRLSNGLVTTQPTNTDAAIDFSATRQQATALDSLYRDVRQDL